jgi:hypothetical protein
MPPLVTMSERLNCVGVNSKGDPARGRVASTSNSPPLTPLALERAEMRQLAKQRAEAHAAANAPSQARRWWSFRLRRQQLPLPDCNGITRATRCA